MAEDSGRGGMEGGAEDEGGLKRELGKKGLVHVLGNVKRKKGGGREMREWKIRSHSSSFIPSILPPSSIHPSIISPPPPLVVPNLPFYWPIGHNVTWNRNMSTHIQYNKVEDEKARMEWRRN